MSIQTVLPLTHVSHETAFVIPDYPYGRLRCERRVWLETKPKKGTRFVSVTKNPKTERWNKPHASTYCEVSGALYLDEKGHVQWSGLTVHSDMKDYENFLQNFGENCTNHAEVVKMHRRLVIFNEEKAKRENPDYGTALYREAYEAAKVRFKEENL